MKSSLTVYLSSYLNRKNPFSGTTALPCSFTIE